VRGRLLAAALAVAAVLVAAAAALLVARDGGGEAAPPAAPTETDPRARFAVDHAEAPVPPEIAGDATYVLGDRLHRLGQPEAERLSHRLQASLVGQNAAVAVPSRDGRFLAYHAWEDETPLLVLRDLRTGEERVLARGAQTVAWGPTGQLAYVQAEPPRYRPGQPYLGHVVVRETVDAPPRRWTTAPGPFEVRAWAGTRLLVAVRYCPACSDDGHPVGLYALDGPGEPDSLPLADLSALSPDARWALGPYQETPGQDSPTPYARLVELETGRVAHTLDVAAAVRDGGGDVAAGGFHEASWRGDEIVAHAATGPDTKLVFLRVVEEQLVVEDVLRPEPETFGARHGVSLGRPTFVGPGTDRVVVSGAWETSGGGYRVAVLSCRRTTRTCTAGEPRDGTDWFALVESPSRP